MTIGTGNPLALAGPQDQPRVSVIIPHFNMPDLLIRCLDSVFAQRLDHGSVEIIVADNGSSTNAAPDWSSHPGVRYVDESQPGPGLARNAGVLKARAPVLLFIDADCRADAGWLQIAVDEVEKSPQDAIIGGDVRIDFVDPARLTAIEAYEAVFAYRQKFYIESLHFSGTGNLAMAKSVFAEVGPFGGIDIAEDRDWGQRAFAAGKNVRYVAAMRIFHPGRISFAELQRKWQRHIAHDLNSHRAAGKSSLRWWLQIAMVFASIFAHAPRLLTSNRLFGLQNRWRGLRLFIRLRLWRCTEMIRANAAAAPVSGGKYWTAQ